MVGWQCQRQEQGAESDKSFIAISAFVTSAARVRMNELRNIAGKRSVYYQGCDGLIVTKDGFDRLDAACEIHQTALGKLKLVEVVNTGEIIGCNDYRLGDRVVIGGRTAQVELGKDGEVLQRKFFGAANLFKGRSLSEVTEELVEWRRTGGTAKGTAGADGWVEPYELTPEYVTGAE
jgi:hypothetical protein